MEGRDARAELSFFAPIAKAVQTNIIEDEAKPLSAGKGGYSLSVGHQAIETVKLWPDFRK